MTGEPPSLAGIDHVILTVDFSMFSASGLLGGSGLSEENKERFKSSLFYIRIHKNVFGC